MVRIVIALVLVAHGIGHSLGLLQLFRIATVNPEWKGDSWLLTGLTGTTVSQIVGAGLWVASIVGFVAVGLVVMGWLPVAWWQPIAVGSAVLSLAGLALFPTAFPLTSAIGALVVDLAVLVAVLWFHWLPADVAL
jgi:hypothetical protein